MKKAKLITVTVITRVIVDEEATEEQVILAALPQLQQNMNNNIFENVMSIEDDADCPFDPENDLA